MLYISGGENLLYVSVSMHKTLSNPYYLLSMEHLQTGKKYQVIPENVTSVTGSPYNNRYDILKVGVFETEDRVNGQVYIDEVGQFFYSIREQVSSTNLDPSLSGEKLEAGILFFDQSFSDTFYYSGETTETYYPIEPTPLPSPSVTPSNTPTNTPTQTTTPTPSITATNTPTSSVTPTPTITPTQTMTQTPSVTPTNTLSATPTNTPTSSVTNTPTVTPTQTMTQTPTNTPTVTPTNTLSATPTNTPTSTQTPSVTPTNTTTPTNTPTPSVGFYGRAFLIDEPPTASTNVSSYLSSRSPSTTFRGFHFLGAVDELGLKYYLEGIASGAITGCTITEFDIPQSGVDQYSFSVTGNTDDVTNTWTSLFIDSNYIGGNCEGYDEWNTLPIATYAFDSNVYEIETSIDNTGIVGAGDYYRCYTTWPDQNMRRDLNFIIECDSPIDVCPV